MWCSCWMYCLQVALDYAKKYDDFAAVVQPFFSNARCDNCTVDVLSDVSSFPSLWLSSHTTHGIWFVYYATLPLFPHAVGLLPPLCYWQPEHGQGPLEQHAHSSCAEEDVFWLFRRYCVPYKLDLVVHKLSNCFGIFCSYECTIIELCSDSPEAVHGTILSSNVQNTNRLWEI